MNACHSSFATLWLWNSAILIQLSKKFHLFLTMILSLGFFGNCARLNSKSIGCSLLNPSFNFFCGASVLLMRFNFSSNLFQVTMPPKQPKKGEKSQKKEGGGGGGKGKKKKWSKGKVRDKLNNAALFDQATYDKLYKEVRFFSLVLLFRSLYTVMTFIWLLCLAVFHRVILYSISFHYTSLAVFCVLVSVRLLIGF